jgi:hypothetical protein
MVAARIDKIVDIEPDRNRKLLDALIGAESVTDR